MIEEIVENGKIALQEMIKLSQEQVNGIRRKWPWQGWPIT